MDTTAQIVFAYQPVLVNDSVVRNANHTEFHLHLFGLADVNPRHLIIRDELRDCFVIKIRTDTNEGEIGVVLVFFINRLQLR